MPPAPSRSSWSPQPSRRTASSSAHLAREVVERLDVHRPLRRRGDRGTWARTRLATRRDLHWPPSSCSADAQRAVHGSGNRLPHSRACPARLNRCLGHCRGHLRLHQLCPPVIGFPRRAPCVRQHSIADLLPRRRVPRQDQFDRGTCKAASKAAMNCSTASVVVKTRRSLGLILLTIRFTSSAVGAETGSLGRFSPTCANKCSHL
jgi:hypothetical protein